MAEQSTNDLLRKKFIELCAERDKTNAELLPLREQCNKFHLDIQKIKDQMEPVAQKIAARMPRQQEVENEIAKLAAALGGRRMSDTAA